MRNLLPDFTRPTKNYEEKPDQRFFSTIKYYTIFQTHLPR